MGIILIAATFGGICAAIASGKKRSPVGWFFIGFLFPLIGLILILVLPNGESMPMIPYDMMDPEQPVIDVPAHRSPLEAIEKLAELRDRGLLSEKEFEVKKAELLAKV